MSGPPSRHPSGPLRAAANAVECANLTLLFNALRGALKGAINFSGGKELAEEFDQRLNDYALEHAWTALTRLPDLRALSEIVPEIDAKMLLSVYQDYSAYARNIGSKVLGDRLFRSALQSAHASLSPHLAELNARCLLIPV